MAATDADTDTDTNPTRPVTMSYKDVTIDPDKDPEDYTVEERRAELLDAITNLGHPDMISRTEWADRYDVDHSRISRDIQHLEDQILDELGTDADLIIHSIFQKGLKELVEAGDWDEAMDYAAKWLDLLARREGTDIRHEADRVKNEIEAAADGDASYVLHIMGDEEDAPTDGAVDVQGGVEVEGFAATPNDGQTDLDDGTGADTDR